MNLPHQKGLVRNEDALLPAWVEAGPELKQVFAKRKKEAVVVVDKVCTVDKDKKGMLGS